MISGYDCLNKKRFNSRRKVDSEFPSTTSVDSVFPMCGATNAKARLLTVDSLTAVYHEYSATSICVVYNMRVYSAVWRRQAESDQHTSRCVRPAQHETVRTSLLSTGQRRWVETTVLPSSCVFCVTDNFSGWVVLSVRCVFVSVFVCVSGQQLSIRVSFSVSFSEKVKKYRWLKWIYVILSNEMRVYHPFEMRFRSI